MALSPCLLPASLGWLAERAGPVLQMQYFSVSVPLLTKQGKQCEFWSIVYIRYLSQHVKSDQPLTSAQTFPQELEATVGKTCNGLLSSKDQTTLCITNQNSLRG